MRPFSRLGPRSTNIVAVRPTQPPSRRRATAGAGSRAPCRHRDVGHVEPDPQLGRRLFLIGHDRDGPAENSNVTLPRRTSRAPMVGADEQTNRSSTRRSAPLATSVTVRASSRCTSTVEVVSPSFTPTAAIPVPSTKCAVNGHIGPSRRSGCVLVPRRPPTRRRGSSPRRCRRIVARDGGAFRHPRCGCGARRRRRDRRTSRGSTGRARGSCVRRAGEATLGHVGASQGEPLTGQRHVPVQRHAVRAV